MKHFPSLSALVNMHDDATSTLDKILSTSKQQYLLHTRGAEMPHHRIGEWEIVGFAAKRATTSYTINNSRKKHPTAEGLNTRNLCSKQRQTLCSLIEWPQATSIIEAQCN
jgi:hypothetical protein